MDFSREYFSINRTKLSVLMNFSLFRFEIICHFDNYNYGKSGKVTFKIFKYILKKLKTLFEFFNCNLETRWPQKEMGFRRVRKKSRKTRTRGWFRRRRRGSASQTRAFKSQRLQGKTHKVLLANQWNQVKNAFILF